jgi:uncharacterized repeat protein (TIGR01451 family)
VAAATPARTADIAVNVTASGIREGGTAVMFIVAASNIGPGDATGIIVHALVPTGLTLANVLLT